jgi:2-amino-4-hydroxy-6-hydroxymethyldihydropteridine diphosphokinase
VAETAYLSMGSNLGDRAGNLREATRRLGALGIVSEVSSLFETEPVEVTSAQPWYLNCALALETSLSPQQLLDGVLDIERSMGRVRTGPRQPRIVDLDILFYGDEVIHAPGLAIPHPSMQQRRFVLEPLAEIAPDFQHPVLKKSVRELLSLLPPESGAARRLDAQP